MSRFQEIWSGQDKQVAPPNGVPAMPDPCQAVGRFREYAVAVLEGMDNTVATRLEINQAKVKLVDRMHQENAFCPDTEQRYSLLIHFFEAIDLLMLLQVRIDPPELVRYIEVKPKVVEEGGIVFAEDYP